MCFAEGTGQFVVSVAVKNVLSLEQLFQDIEILHLGTVLNSGRFVVRHVMDEKISDIVATWTKGL